MFDIETKSNEIITSAVLNRASDVHIIPISLYSIIQFRVDNQLIEVEKLKNNEAEKLISHFKFRSKMDIGERRKPQSGSIKTTINNTKINFRISTLPTTPHESLSIRILPQNEIETIDHLALFPNQSAILKSLIKKEHGLILVSGPTGSGKTTTIYSLLIEAKAKNKRIISIEDPVEKRMDTLIQVEINQKAGLTFADSLKAVLRHDPDIIMIGEIRDVETAKIAVRAALTGHLVISSIHANNCFGCISRLREFGINEIDIKETVIGLVSQRLVELRCPICGDDCSMQCRKYRKRRRMALYEILAEKSLEKYLLNSKEPFRFESMGQIINKSIVLGFVSNNTAERWLVE